MNVAIIGMCNEAMILAKIIKNSAYCHNADADRLKISGVICKNATQTTNMAIELNIKAYLTLNDAIKDADILFVAQPDSTLAYFSEVLKGNCVRNKILCHFSRKYDSDILSCGTTNSCYSVVLPYLSRYTMRSDHYMNNIVVFEGYGKRHDEFEKAAENTLEKITFCNKHNHRMCMMSSRMINEYLKAVILTAKQIAKFANTYDENIFKSYIINTVSEACNADTLTYDKDADEIKKNMRVLSALNYSDTKDFVRNMELHLALNSEIDTDEKDEILRVLKYKPGRN